jgi:hypothetical protein
MVLPLSAAANLRLDASLVYEHDRDVIADRVDAFAFDAFEATLVRLEFHGGLTERTHEDFEQVFTDRHS